MRLAGGVLTAKQAPRRPGTALAPGLPAGVSRGHASPVHRARKEDRHVALRWRDDRGFGPSLPDGTSPAAGDPAAAAVTTLNEPFAMPDDHGERRGSTFFLVSFSVAMAGVMVG